MDPRQERERLAGLLETALEEAGLTTRAASGALGRPPGYLARVIGGRRPLELEVLFGLLELAHVHPRWFFARHYPPAAGGDAPAGDAAGLARLEAQIERARQPADAAGWAHLTRLLLQREIRLQGRTEQEVSRAAGLDEQLLGRALGDGNGLSVEHLFAVLAAVATPAAVFFAELTAAERTPTTVYLPADVKERVKTVAEIRGVDLSSLMETAFELLWRHLADDERWRAHQMLEARRRVRALTAGAGRKPSP